ncbi:zinc finger protein 462-like [Boleophthalmus pectinirostris]|uniref:zinc finger protein 462-like n=1 Tax=Boleophthalmus pectinirostris TaxID=150288 RepID=UPI000A1C5B45|nr:zinc finger protein 462-like [Boleophthalmus pectinirostris]XP_055017641.1 zinc finger protein 462-like [Boleophthalmus pectinirostris]
MQNDSAHHAFGNMTPSQAAPQDTATSFNCNHCVLIFRTRVYLYEHLHQVHGLSIESALRDSGLKSVPQSKSKPDTSLKVGKTKLDISLKLGKNKLDKSKLKKTNFAFNCKNCNFKSANWAIYHEHKQQCTGFPNNENQTGKTSFLIHKDEASPGTANHEKAKHKSTPNDVKMYSKSPQTITKYFTTSTTLKSDCETNKTDRKTLRLEESSLNSSGVFQVTATSIDLASKNVRSLISDLDMISDPTSAKPVDPFKEVLPKNSGKRLANETAESSPSKKTKLEIETPFVKLNTSSGKLSLEFSDDEEKLDLDGKELIKNYFCKHCQYNTTDLMHLVSHYQDNHPYIKCNSAYIEEKSDQTAIFRCLECPVEFAVEAHLHDHYSKDHPDSPGILSLKLADLVHKCFVCPFTAKILQSLKEHYKEKHPSQKVENPLWYSKYSSAQQDGSLNYRISEEDKSPEMPETERTTTADESMAYAPKSYDGTLYYCGKCAFSHKSVVVLHVHYKKSHPEEPITLDKIKQLVIAPTVGVSEEKPGTEQNISRSFALEESWASPVSDSEDENISADHNLQAAPHTIVLDSATSSSPIEKMFFCKRCNFSKSNIKSVLSHHNAKHGKTTTIEEVLRYSAEIAHKNVIPVHNSEANANVCPRQLYYCQECNYGNPTIIGILNHQNKLHAMSKGKSAILTYTAMIHDQIEKSETHPNDSFLPSGLPLPLIKDGTGLLFCHLCNYRNSELSVVTAHYVKSHKGIQITTQEIAEHTAMVYERLNISPQIKSTVQNQKVTLTKTSVIEPETKAKLKCIKCSYSTNHLYRMRKHLRSAHKNNVSFSDIVGLCGTEAIFQPGYYCDICSFCHEDLKMVKCHGVNRHGRHLSDKFINSCMYLSPDVCDPQKRDSAFNNDTTKAKEDSSKKQDCNNKHDNDDDNGDEEAAFDSYQVPLDFDNLNVSAEDGKHYNCLYCSATFEGHGGLLIHMGMKHRSEITNEMPQLEMTERTQVFKCHSCNYVNNIKQGVVTHCLMKHPNKALKINSIYVTREHLKNVEMKVKMGTWKFCGFICKDCSQIFPSKEKLKSHHTTHKNPPVQNTDNQLQHEQVWCQHCGFYCASEKEHTDHLRVCPKNYSIFSCALCPDAFITRVRLGIHYTKKHGKEASLKYYTPLHNQQSKVARATSAQPVSRESKMILMYKCPSCRYVNSSCHGTLTHCQMLHPKIVVRAGKLKTLELDLANMIGCVTEKQTTFGGYRCRKCPLVYGGLKKLKRHCEMDHKPSARATSQEPAVHDNALSSVSESATSDQKKLVSKFCHFFKCSLCSYSTSILKQLGNHYMQRHGKSSYMKYYSPLFHQGNKPKISLKHEEIGQTKNPLEQTEKTTVPQQVYKCSSCSYGSAYRRYLIAHLKNRHKYDSKAVYKHMEKYKDYKSTLPSGQFTCKKCHNVGFESKFRLLVHYRTFHISEMQIDFTIIAKRRDRSTGVYKCNYCKKKLFGIKNLWKHLDQHRARWLRKQKELEVKVTEEDTVPSLNPVEEETGLNVMDEEAVISHSASASSHSGFEVPEVSEEQYIEGIHNCLRCKRSFKSLKGLRSHERSHAALAALDIATTSDSQERINQYITYRTGTTRPFMCALCTYRTPVLSLLKNHIIKKHPHVLNSAEVDKHLDKAAQRDNDAPQNGVDDMNADDDEPENSYLEPPDVQRQLKHYNIMAQVDPASKTQNIQLSDPRMLPCEMCNFNCQHYSNMRRHYLRRHGKKLIRCKDCNFFSCFKQNLDLHEQMGHSTFQSKPTHLKNLCCPFCLYQSKNKNNMIDHIVLHREERVMPIEVRRSKLSRYLQGIVFRCYKCTFTSGSADSLHLHMAKHNDLKPFKCRLCYFDCTQLRELEAHLCDKHQVLRNHQLVGQVCLDQLESIEDRIPQNDGDEMLYDPENNETIMKNKNEQSNENQEDAEENLSNSDSPKMQSASEAAEDASESSPMCVEEDLSQDNPQSIDANMEHEKQNNTTENDSKMLSVAALDSKQDCKKTTDIHNTVPEKMSTSVAPKISQEVQENQHKTKSAEECPYGDMPILEKYFKEQRLVFAQSSENFPCSMMRDGCDKESSEVYDMENGLQEAHNSPPVLQATDRVAVNVFPCDYCGRSLSNTSELERHMMRHGM